jgi:hypothetical protein
MSYLRALTLTDLLALLCHLPEFVGLHHADEVHIDLELILIAEINLATL